MSDRVGVALEVGELLWALDGDDQLIIVSGCLQLSGGVADVRTRIVAYACTTSRQKWYSRRMWSPSNWRCTHAGSVPDRRE